MRRQLAYAKADALDNSIKLDAGEDDTDWRVAMFSVPKSGRERTLELTANTVAALKRHYQHQLEFRMRNKRVYESFDLVFAKEMGHKHEGPGRPLPPDSLDHEFKKVVAAAKVSPLSIHACRHSCATNMLLRGIAPVVVAKHLGHSNTTVTLSIYAHCLPNAETEAAKVRAQVRQGRN